jgi:hypothetical protein
MTERHEAIDDLIERSSLGTPDARLARATVSRAVAQRIVATSTTDTAALRRSVVTGSWDRKRKKP